MPSYDHLITQSIYYLSIVAKSRLRWPQRTCWLLINPDFQIKTVHQLICKYHVGSDDFQIKTAHQLFCKYYVGSDDVTYSLQLFKDHP